LIIALLFHGKWLAWLYVVAGTLLISVVDRIGIRQKSLNTHKSYNTSVQKLIPSDLYEWKAGVRKNFTLLLIIYGVGICLSYFVAAIPIAMLIIGLIISDFFIPYESWQMLLSFEKGPKQMLLYKIKRHFLLYTICSLPLVILFVLFHPDLWYIPFIEFIILLFIHIYMITIKFAYFSFDGNNRINFILQIIGIIVGLIPLTTPFLLLFSIFFFQKACTNLKPLLYDYN
jgi:hypothetical protein